VYVTFRAKSALVPGVPRKVWGVGVSTYSKNNARYYGYKFRLDEVVRNVLLGYGGNRASHSRSNVKTPKAFSLV